MPEANYCSVRGCGRPAHFETEQAFANVVLKLWLCDTHREAAGEQLAIDLSRAEWSLKTPV